jgi:hypothetical protein
MYTIAGIFVIVMILVILTGQPTLMTFDRCANIPGTQYWVPGNMVKQNDSCFRAVTR